MDMQRTEGEGDDPIRDLRGETAVAVEDVATDHVLRGALAEGGDSWRDYGSWCEE